MTTIIASSGSLVDVALDVGGGKLYWSEFTNNKIRRANLDGTVAEDLTTPSDPYGIALDLTNNKLYWITYNSTTVGRSNLDGTSSSSIITSVGGQGVDIEVNPAGGTPLGIDLGF